MTKEDFKAELTFRLLDDIITQKNIGTKDNPVYGLDEENMVNHLKLIKQIADFTFGDKE